MGRLSRRYTDSIPDLPAGFVEHLKQNGKPIQTLDDLIAELKKWKEEAQ